jgi:hypothetical protein
MITKTVTREFYILDIIDFIEIIGLHFSENGSFQG